MKFDVKHVIWAVVLALLWAVASWLLGMLGQVGGYLVVLLGLAVSFGLFFYAFKDVKGLMDGIVTGLVYLVVFLVVGMILHLIGWDPGFIGLANYFFLPFGGWTMFGMIEFWLALVGFLLFTGFLGWTNEQK